MIGVFTAAGECFRQIRGTSIGNQISPALSLITVAYREHLWLQGFQPLAERLLTTQFLRRYVDNRILIYDASVQSSECLCTLLMPSFYKEPVVLEPVGTSLVLGCDVDVALRTVRYSIPCTDWQFVHPSSAGTPQQKLASFRSRSLIISRQVWPPELRPDAMRQLIVQYRSRGFAVDEKSLICVDGFS